MTMTTTVDIPAWIEKAREIRTVACERAEDTWVVEMRDRHSSAITHVMIVAHPGQLEADPGLLDPERLLREHGLVPGRNKVIRLSQSIEAPRPWSPKDALRHARRAVALLREEQAVRARIEAEVMERAERELADLEAAVMAMAADPS